MLFHFRPGAKSPDFDQRHGPPGQFGDFLDRPLFDFQQRDDHAGSGGELLEHAINELPGGGGAFIGLIRVADKPVKPVILRFGEFGKGGFTVALVAAQEIVAGADGQAHQPMFKGSFATDASEFVEGFEPDFLYDVLDLAFPAGVTTGGGKNARGVFHDQRLEAGGVALQHRGNEFRVGSFHLPANHAKGEGETEAKSLGARGLFIWNEMALEHPAAAPLQLVPGYAPGGNVRRVGNDSFHVKPQQVGP
jgi:hypothetical protein